MEVPRAVCGDLAIPPLEDCLDEPFTYLGHQMPKVVLELWDRAEESLGVETLLLLRREGVKEKRVVLALSKDEKDEVICVASCGSSYDLGDCANAGNLPTVSNEGPHSPQLLPENDKEGNQVDLNCKRKTEYPRLTGNLQSGYTSSTPLPMLLTINDIPEVSRLLSLRTSSLKEGEDDVGRPTGETLPRGRTSSLPAHPRINKLRELRLRLFGPPEELTIFGDSRTIEGKGGIFKGRGKEEEK